MQRKPTDPKSSIISRKSVSLMFILAFNMMIILLPQFGLLLKKHDLLKAQTIVFITMVFMEMINAYNSRSEGSLIKINPFANKWLNLAVLSSILATILIVQVPALTYIFKTSILTFSDWGLALLLSLSALLFSEATKLFLNKKL